MSLFVAAAAVSFLFRRADQASVASMASTSRVVGSTVPRTTFSLVSRLDEASLTAGGDDASGWDEEDESVDNDESADDDDGKLEVGTASVTCGGSAGPTR